MDITQIISVVENAISELPIPKSEWFGWLTYCLSMRRTGISTNRAIANIYAWMESAGVPTGVNPDGSPNLITATAGAITKAVMDEICDNAYISASAAPGSIMVTGTGGNAGGPVQITGYNINFPTINGFIQ